MAATEATRAGDGAAPKDDPPLKHASLAEALLAAQEEMPAIERDATNPHFKSKFTSLDNLLAKVRPVLNRHGITTLKAAGSSDTDALREAPRPATTTTRRYVQMAATEATRAGDGAAPKDDPPLKHASLAEALLAAQEEMPAIERDATNPHFKSKFTSLDNLLAKVRPVLNRHGISVQQFPASDAEGKPALTTILRHASGESEAHTAPLLLAKSDPQGLGSAITYMRRYALAAALAIADQEDDDGNGASSGGSNANGRSGATAVRREGQGDGKSMQATADQRKAIFAECKRLEMEEHHVKGWLAWNAGTTMTDRIPYAQAEELVGLLRSYQNVGEALSTINEALERGDEKAEQIVQTFNSGGH